MILALVESDKYRSLSEKLAEYLARPPQPVLKFYNGFSTEITDGGRHILFAVRNGLPVPLLYGIYTKATYNEATDYLSKTDHIGPFSSDNWRLTLDTTGPAQVEIRVGLVPFEIVTDRAEIAVGG